MAIKEDSNDGEVGLGSDGVADISIEANGSVSGPDVKKM